MLHVLETNNASSEGESKMIKLAIGILRFFSVDTTDWNKTKAIKWILPKAILATAILGFAFLTVRTSWPIIEDYSQMPTFYTQKLQSNQTMALPLSKVCLPLSSFELDNYWKKKNSALPDQNATYYQNLLAAIFEDSDAKSIAKQPFLEAENKWSNSLLFVVHHYLSFIYEFDALYGKNAIENLDKLNNSYNDLSKAIKILDGRMKPLNISTNQLKMKYGSQIKDLFELAFRYGTISTEYMMIEVESFFFSIEKDYICYIAHLDQHPLKKKESMRIEAKRSNLPNLRSNYDDRIRMTIGIGGRLLYGVYDDYERSTFDSYVRYFALQVTSTFRTKSHIGGEQRCSDYNSIDNCISVCRKIYFQRKCGCNPTFGQMKPELIENECYLADYITCFNREYPSDSAQADLIQCEESCIDVCEQTNYHYVIGSDKIYFPNGTSYRQEEYSLIELVFATFDYPIFEEKLKWTFHSFIGVLGGALGLWLGINVLDTIDYAACGIKILIRAFSRNRTQETNTQRQSNSNKTRHPKTGTEERTAFATTTRSA